MSFAEENRKQYHKLHKQVLLLGWVLVPLIFILEVILLLVNSPVAAYLSNRFVLRMKMIIPTTANFIAMILATVFLNSDKINLRMKNWISVFSIFILCTVTSIFHGEFRLVILAPCFTILFSTIFADAIMVIAASISSGGAVALSIMLALITKNDGGVDIATTIAIGIILFFCVILISRLMIKHSLEQKLLIYSYSSNQEELIDELHIEPMTGLSNKTTMNETILLFIQKYYAGECTPHLVLIDIDHFKNVNDIYGHNAGDEVIKNLAAIIRKNMQGVIHAFRFGGDEMVLIFGKETLSEIKTIIENIRNEFKQSSYSFSPEKQITLSVGCAHFYKGLNQKTWFELADSVMYKSKEGGRDSVTYTEE